MSKLVCSQSSETVSAVHNRKKLQVASLVSVVAGEQELGYNGKKFLHLKYALSGYVVILKSPVASTPQFRLLVLNVVLQKPQSTS